MSDEVPSEIIAPGNDRREEQIEITKETTSDKTLQVIDEEIETDVEDKSADDESFHLESVKNLRQESREAMSAASIDLTSLVHITKAHNDEIEGVENMFAVEEKEEMEQTEKSFVSLSIQPRLRGLSLQPVKDAQQVSVQVSVDSIASSQKSTISEILLQKSSRAILKGQEPEEGHQIDRAIYYELYKMYSKKMEQQRMKNRFLQTRLADYYKKKRMFYVLLPGPGLHADMQKKYEKLLDELETVSDTATREQAASEDELDDLKRKCRYKSGDIEMLLEKLQKAETEVYKEIMSNEPDLKSNSEKILDRYLKQQRNQVAILTQIRVNFLKTRNNYEETQAELDALDNLGSNFHLIDYEQLKCDNRNFHDKLEEKELVLNSLRRKCQNAMQTLAHTREKSTALDTDIRTFDEQLDTVTDEYMDVREQLAALKLERDTARQATAKMKERSGLLTKPKLLKDMENAINDASEGCTKLQQYKDGYDLADKAMKFLRMEINGTKISRRPSGPQVSKKRMSMRQVT